MSAAYDSDDEAPEQVTKQSGRSAALEQRRKEQEVSKRSRYTDRVPLPPAATGQHRPS